MPNKSVGPWEFEAVGGLAGGVSCGMEMLLIGQLILEIDKSTVFGCLTGLWLLDA